MKVILLEDDVRLGDKGAEVDVKRGYAKNFLIPHQKAMPASRGNRIMMENELRSQKGKIEKEKAHYQVQADQLKTIQLDFLAKAGLTGHLYGTITTQDVVDQIKDKTGLEISKKKVILNTHIKTEGSYLAHIKLFSGINVSVPVIVTIDKPEEPKEKVKTKLKSKPAEKTSAAEVDDVAETVEMEPAVETEMETAEVTSAETVDAKTEKT